ncbi:cytochrome b/b6 domain-containing protein [Ramlibacter sp. XY19]|uniref:cytochrome b/b6 domain-containing protein n=1 Tax=Ramlibacter paludis TaxID=2908000 RepID=UPI0023DB3AA2|nr:cytochrome b/b6 domain-containing protein [Ramlibacter paludis]MCG2595871.1 cytochrome b/b6 domain-containing protein [Ramlibacter paludis]
MAYRVRVWDLPTRVFHWLLVACVAGLIATGYTGGAAMEWHARLGYCVLTLLLFRIAWGFVGGRWTRFANFLYHPRSVLAYLRGQSHPDHLIGHNPLGAGSVYAMLLVLLAQVGTGLVADDEIAFTGPLNRFVSSARGLAATWYHKEIGQRLLIALVLLHLAAIAYYAVKKKQNLVGPMIRGDKEVATPATSSRDDAVSRVGAAVVLAVAAGIVTWVVRLGTAG